MNRTVSEIKAEGRISDTTLITLTHIESALIL